MVLLSTDSPLPIVDSQFCDRVIRVSCTKIIGARQERGGPKLYKNLLVLHTLKSAREEQKKIEAIEAAMLITENILEIVDEDEEMIQPPLEFSVTDDEDGLVLDADAPLVFATEATELCEMEEEPLKKISSPPAALSSALNDALAKIGSSIDRKRKPNSKTVAQPQKKATRVTLSCK